jgi:hypothetical protein
MQMPEDVEYTVVLVSSSPYEERENAEQIIEEALEYLNTFREEPGFRFAPYVTAHLEIVPDVEEAQGKLDNDDSVAMMILHDLDRDERRAFTRQCNERNVPVCITTPAPEGYEDRPKSERIPPREWKVVFRKRAEDDDEPHAHRIVDATLSAPLEDDPDELGGRVWQLIAVMALGVMEHHWRLNPPKYSFLPPNS